MIGLDAPFFYQRLDRHGMAQRLRETPQDCLRGWQAAQEFPLPQELYRAKRILFLGMGGSAIIGDFLQALALAPVQVCRELSLPPGIDADTLVIASSFSGNTEETLSAFAQALETPARKLALAGGGELAEICRAKGVPLFLIDHPGPPRATLAYSTLALAGIAARLGLLQIHRMDVVETANLLDGMVAELDTASPTAQNPSKGLALRLYGRVPVIYGGDILAPVARRWKTEFNENAKAWAFYEVLPEAGHNAVVGYEFPRSQLLNATLLLLQSAEYSPRLRARFRVAQEILAQRGVSHEVVVARGQGALSQMLSLVLLGDYTSYYLACLYQVDPWPVDIIDFWKKRLTEI
ncbi:MAG: bifunctional phosphoglucose/phosphomannose isomerase [Chloroflexi bacterium]|nr:bifunctional phosphoglucose/phosphomannose isomerase [Chloroflexota bacterium]